VVLCVCTGREIVTVATTDGQVEVLELDTLERASTLPGLKGASLFAAERDSHLTYVHDSLIHPCIISVIFRNRNMRAS
jgi:hypothetical protein